MKYVKRILTLPFALPIWIISLSIKWVRYGGELRVNIEKEGIDVKELYKLLTELNDKL